jgi:hypothetical protein
MVASADRWWYDDDREYERDGLGADFTDFLSDLDKISKYVNRMSMRS